MTMRVLAQRAGVSERFLVQLEAGEGNISVARLEDVGEALGTSAAVLLERASRPASIDAREVVALVGLRGAGKSAVGGTLARALGVPFVELDDLVVKRAQMTLSTLFEIHGEAYYRSIEREVLRELLDRGRSVVVATGGSIVTDPETWGMLRTRAKTVWLRASPADHWNRVVAQGDVRPMRDRPRAKNELKALLSSREALYGQAAAVVDTSTLTVEEVARAVAAQIEG